MGAKIIMDMEIKVILVVMEVQVEAMDNLMVTAKIKETMGAVVTTLMAKILQAMEEIINMVVLKQHRNYSHQKVKHSPSLITKWNIAFSYPPSGQTSVNFLVYTPTFIFSILFRILKTLKTQVCFKRTAGRTPISEETTILKICHSLQNGETYLSKLEEKIGWKPI